MLSAGFRAAIEIRETGGAAKQAFLGGDSNTARWNEDSESEPGGLAVGLEAKEIKVNCHFFLNSGIEPS